MKEWGVTVTDNIPGNGSLGGMLLREASLSNSSTEFY